MELKNIWTKKNIKIMKEQEQNKTKDFPLLKIVVFGIYGLLIYLLYYLIKYGI